MEAKELKELKAGTVAQPENPLETQSHGDNSAKNPLPESKSIGPLRSISAATGTPDSKSPKPHPKTEERKEIETVAFSNAWVTLGLYGILTITDHIIWISFWPIMSRGREYFGVGSVAIFMLSIIYVIDFILFAPAAGQRVDRKGLRHGVLVGAFLMFFGSLIKVAPAPFKMNGIVGYVFVFLGHLVGGIAHCFILILPPKLAQNWFRPHERVTAQAICTILNQLGITLGIFLTPFIGGEERISLLLLIHFVLSLLVLIVELIFFVGESPKPPSLSTTCDPGGSSRRDSQTFLGSFSQLWKTTKSLIHVPGFFLTSMSVGVGMGAYYAIWLLLSLHGMMSTTDALVEVNALLIYNLAGVIGAITAALSIDRWGSQHRSTVFITFIGFAMSLLVFSLSIIQGDRAFIAICCAVMGIFGTALPPTSTDLIMEITFPAPQATTNAIALVIGQIWTLIFIFGNLEMKNHYAPALFLALGTFVAVFAFGVTNNKNYKRRRYESQARHGIRGQMTEQSGVDQRVMDGQYATRFFTLDNPS